MKIFNALLLLITAGLISAIAAYMSIYGMLALFPTGGLIIALMMGFLEFGKLVNAAWIHSNWHSKNVSRLHKTYLTAAVAALMIITSMGIYGFLAKSHLEQTGPEGNIQVQIDQKNQELAPLISQRDQLLKEQQSSNAVINGLLQSNQAKGAGKFLRGQQSANAGLQTKIDAVDAQINAKNTELVPLKLKVNEVESKLGPIKYVGKLFGFKDSENAVQMVIMILIFVFDPLAVVMLISGTITWHEFLEERRTKKTILETNVSRTRNNTLEELPELPVATVSEEEKVEPFWKALGFDSEEDHREHEKKGAETLEKFRAGKHEIEKTILAAKERIAKMEEEKADALLNPPEPFWQTMGFDSEEDQREYEEKLLGPATKIIEAEPEQVLEVSPAIDTVETNPVPSRIIDYSPVLNTSEHIMPTLQTEADLKEKNTTDLRDQLVSLLEQKPELLADIMAAIDEAKLAREEVIAK